VGPAFSRWVLCCVCVRCLRLQQRQLTSASPLQQKVGHYRKGKIIIRKMEVRLVIHLIVSLKSVINGALVQLQ
jgi:hypothetical protein